jgi:molecular chaperone DnaK (HSP70)
MTTAECRFCRQWETAALDTYCSFCGSLLLLLDVTLDSSVLISTLAPTRKITMRNGSAHAMQVAIEPKGSAPSPAVAFAPGSSVTVPANGETHVMAGVDGALLTPGFHRTLEYACVVDGDERKQRIFRLEVRSGPMPKLLTQAIDFEDVREGESARRTIELTNGGSVPLRLRAVRGNGSPHLSIEGEYAERLLRYDEKLSIPVLWNATGDDVADSGTVHIEFGNCAASLAVPVRARTFRYRLDVKPPAVRFANAVAKRDYAQTLRIENRGTTDIEIESIESDQPWLEVIARASRFTLLCGESAGRTLTSPTIFARFFDFKVFCRRRTLAEGKHRAAVTIRPHGQASLVVPVEITIVKTREYQDYIGIDFGTTNSVVAVMGASQRDIDLVKDEVSGGELIPSVLVFDDPDTYKIGQAARNEADTAPDRTVRSIKRVMGYESDRTFFDRSYSAAELASRIIQRLVELAEKKLQLGSSNAGQWNVRRAIITVPANFYDLQIRDVLEACREADLDTEEDRAHKAEQLHREEGALVNAGIILDEPSAAVLYYIDFLRRTGDAAAITEAIARERGLTLLVFDYGGGTLDVSVANVTKLPAGGTGLRILANMGDNTIGGDHIDVMLMKELLRRCVDGLPSSKFDFDTTLIAANFRDLDRRREREEWTLDVWQHLLRARAQWKDLAERVKIDIAQARPSPVVIAPDLILRVSGGNVQQAPVSITIQPFPDTVFENLLQPVLEKSAELIEASLALAGIETKNVDYILHTGRQSLLPHIRRRVRAAFPNLGDERDLLEEKHLKVCVAKGAALYGSMRDRLVAREARILFLSEGRKLPHSYGVETFLNPIEPEFDEVIKRGESYPVERTKPYPPDMVPPAGYLNLKFYQNTGVSKRIVGNPHVSLIGQISIDTAGHAGCDVTFSVGANRTLEVFANSAPVTIEPARLHEEESWMG